MKRHRATLATLSLALFAANAAWPQDGSAGDTKRRRLDFSGLVDADFVSDFGSLDRLRHTTGLQVDLTTRIFLNPSLYAELRTAMRDGGGPMNGAGDTWAPLRYDGAQFNWSSGDGAIWMAGDLVAGTGYLHYYRYKRVAALVSEHNVRGVGYHRGDLLVHAGAVTDTFSTTGEWSVFVEWKRPVGDGMTWTPSARFTGGIARALPFELGVAFDGTFLNDLTLNGHAAMNYWSAQSDPGSVFLLEGRYPYGAWFFSGTMFVSNKGEVPSSNVPRRPVTGEPLDDMLLHLEPGRSLDERFAVSLPLEYRNSSFDASRDESVWITPSLHAYPARRAEWRVWTGLAKPLANGRAGMPFLTLGSEIDFTF